MRRAVKKRHTPGPDQVYNSVKVTKLINYIMIGGGKETARKVVYQALDEIREKTKTENPVEILEEALRNVSPQMEVRSRRVGGANYQVPREVRPERRLSLAIRWIAGTARSRKGTAMYKKLAEELIAAANNEGEAVKKKENMHKMAEANRAFAHFAW